MNPNIAVPSNSGTYSISSLEAKSEIQELHHAVTLEKQGVETVNETSLHNNNMKNFKWKVFFGAITFTALLGTMLMMFSMDHTSVGKMENKKKENFVSQNLKEMSLSVTGERSLLGCSEELAELSRELIGANAIRGPFPGVQIGDIFLPCFPRNALKYSNVSTRGDNLRFSNVIIGVVEEGALNTSIGFNIVRVDFYESHVYTFENQDKSITFVNFRNTEVGKFPDFFPAEQIYLENLVNFIPSIEFINFITSSPKAMLSMTRMWDDENLNMFHKLLRESNKSISFEQLGGSIRIVDNEITTLPKNFLDSESINSTTDSLSLTFASNSRLSYLPDFIFAVDPRTNFRLVFENSNQFVRLPLSTSYLNLNFLRLYGTGVDSFENVDFRKFPELVEMSLAYSPINPLCSNQASFKEHYVIALLKIIGENLYIEKV
eukprot:snap_masked-scaffold_8-processed-gene-4.20-mRNA-1 protein AED:1.00 eAED:1.00 QI:0/0/0/0/1/1/2/0/432